MIIAVDFDGVIHDYLNPLPGRKMGEPIEGAVESLHALVDAGHGVVIHTARAAGGLKAGDHIRAWMDYWWFPRLQVTAIKPNADLFIDDRAVRFTSWEALGNGEKV